MSSLNSGYEVVVRLHVDRSDPDAVIAELQRGITVPVRYASEAAPAAGSQVAGATNAEPITFGNAAAQVAAAAAGGAPIFLPPAPSAGTTGASAADSLRQPIPIQLNFAPARASLQEFASEVSAAMRTSFARAIPNISPASTSFEKPLSPYAVAGQNLNGGSVQTNQGTLRSLGSPDVNREPVRQLVGSAAPEALLSPALRVQEPQSVETVVRVFGQEVERESAVAPKRQPVGPASVARYAPPTPEPEQPEQATGQPDTRVFRDVYHGTEAEKPIERFVAENRSGEDVNALALGPGAYFAQSRSRAETFGQRRVYTAELAIPNPFDLEQPLPPGSASRYNEAASAIGAAGLPKGFGEETDPNRVYGELVRANEYDRSKVRSILEGAGHGGMAGHGDVVAFRHEQIKVKSVESQTEAERTARFAAREQEAHEAGIEDLDLPQPVPIAAPVAQAVAQPIHAPHPATIPKTSPVADGAQSGSDIAGLFSSAGGMADSYATDIFARLQAGKSPIVRAPLENKIETAYKAGNVQSVDDVLGVINEHYRPGATAANARAIAATAALGTSPPVATSPEPIAELPVAPPLARYPFARALASQTSQELSETFGIDLTEVPAPVTGTSEGGGPPRRPPSAAAPSGEGEGEQGRPILVRLDLEPLREAVRSLGADLAAGVRQAAQARPDKQAAPGGTEVSSRAEKPEELYRKEAAAVGPATDAAIARATRTGALPTVRQIQKQFPDLGPEAARDVLDEARGQQRERRVVERQRYRQDTVDFAEFRRANREATRGINAFGGVGKGDYGPVSADEEQAEEDAGSSPSKDRPVGAGRRTRNPLDRYIGPGYVAHEILRIAQAGSEYSQATGLADSQQARVQAETQLASSVSSIPILGQAVDLLTATPRYEILRTQADAERQEQRTELARSQGAAQLDLRNRADIAGVRGFGREAIGIDQANRAEQRAIQDRARERGISNQRETEARQSQIEHDYEANRPDDVPEAYNYVARLIGAPTVVTENDQSHDAAVEAARRAADYRTKVSVARQRDDQAEASRLDAENRRQLKLDRDYAGSGYDIAGARATLSGLPYADRNRERQIFTGQTAREAAELGRQNDPNLVAAYRRQRAGEELGLEASFVRDDRSFRADTIQRETAIASTGARERNQPFEAQIVEIAGSTRAALAAPPPQNLTLFQQQQRAAGIAAEGVAKQQDVVAGFQRDFYQQTVQLGYQRQQAEANLAFRPLESTLLGIDAEHARRNAEVDALPLPLQPQRRAEIAQLFGVQGRPGLIQQQATQAFEVQGAFKADAIQADIDQLNLRIDGPGSPALRGLLAEARGIAHATKVEEAQAIDEGHPEFVPGVRTRGTRQLQAFEAEFIQGFRTQETNRGQDISGPNTGNPGAVLAEINADITKIKDDTKTVANAASAVQQIYALLQKLVPDVAQ